MACLRFCAYGQTKIRQGRGLYNLTSIFTIYYKTFIKFYRKCKVQRDDTLRTEISSKGQSSITNIDIICDQYIDIVFNKKITSDTFLMGLRSPEIVKAARPGQFVMIRVRAGSDPLLRRPFSICGIRDDLFLVLYRVVGQGTAIMAEVREGERLSVLGPLGVGFDVPKNDQISLLVAGGIGIAPLFFLAQSMKIRNIRFMAGFGSSGEIIRIERIGEPRVDVSIATDDGTEGYTGTVTALLDECLKKHGPEKDSLSVFTCGPRPMLKKVAAMTMEREIDCQASLEASMACGLGACQGCAVKTSSYEGQTYFHVCRDGPVFPAQSIDWGGL